MERENAEHASLAGFSPSCVIMGRTFALDLGDTRILFADFTSVE
jgi:hypothetical protein